MFFQPARKIKPKTKGYRGKEPFLTTGKMVPWESFLERDYIRLADFDFSIEEIYAQPVRITYLYNGKIREHFPDFKVINNEHQVVIVEVKPMKFVDREDNQIKFLAGRAYCEERGWKYIQMTEDDIRPGFLQQNLALLRSIGTQDIPDSILDTVLSRLEKVNHSTISELRTHCSDLTEEEYYGSIYQLIYFQEIDCELILQPVSQDSIIQYKE